MPGAGAVLVFRLRDAEEHHRRDPEPDELHCLPDEAVHRVPPERGESRVRERLGRHEERQHEVAQIEPRLARERAKGAGAPEATEPGGREGAHARKTTPFVRLTAWPEPAARVAGLPSAPRSPPRLRRPRLQPARPALPARVARALPARVARAPPPRARARAATART